MTKKDWWDDYLPELPEELKKLPYGTLARLREQQGYSYLYHKIARRLCGFELVDRGENDAEWIARPQVLFRPYALMLWGAPERSKVRHCVIGQNGQIQVSGAPVPASFFATGHSFEEVVRRFEKDGIDAPYWCDFDTFEVGTRMKLKITTEEGEPVRKLEAVLLGMAAL